MKPFIDGIDSNASTACYVSKDEDDQDSSKSDPDPDDTINMKRATQSIDPIPKKKGLIDEVPSPGSTTLFANTVEAAEITATPPNATITTTKSTIKSYLSRHHQ